MELMYDVAWCLLWYVVFCVFVGLPLMVWIIYEAMRQGYARADENRLRRIRRMGGYGGGEDA